MKVAKLIEPGRIELINEPFQQKAGDGEAVVRVRACGICGTDMHIFKEGRADVVLPRVMGHEFSGTVVETGAGVQNVAAGDRVVFDPVMACGVCPVCRKGRPNVCPSVKCYGVQMDGAFREYVVVPASHLYKVPEGLSDEAAALCEPFSVAANILSRAEIARGEKIVVIGAGTIGLCILQAAVGLGCEVLISDIVDKKLKIAESFGAHAAVNTANTSLEEAVAAFAPDGPDVVIDAVGSSALMEMSLRLATPLTRVMVISFDARPAQVFPVEITKKELTILGSRMNAGKFPKVIQWLKDGIIDPEKMVEQVFPIEQIKQAFELATTDSTLKKIIIGM